MDKEIISKIFEPFFTTKEAGKGTGLGLATVYGIIKQNNGFINIYSEPDHGTTVKIYLPRHFGKGEAARHEGAQTPAAKGRETILIVEDEPALLNMSRRMLEKQGYQVLSAATPGEALSLAGEYRGNIDLLMTVVVMPEMNGRELAKNILILYPEIKCLFNSGYTADIIALHGVLDEGVHFLQKPFSTNILAAKVREVLDGNNF
jgi:CheY-like chemotaxis protein